MTQNMSPTPTPTPTPDDAASPRRRPPGAAVVLHAVPVLAALTVALSSLLLRDDLPDPVAVHWSGSTADGFLSLQATTALTFVMVLVLGLGMTIAAGRMPGRLEAATLAASGLGLPAFLTVLHLGTLQANRGTDGVAVPFPAWALGIGALSAVALGLLGWWLAPAPVAQADAELDAPEVDIAPGESVVWTGRAAAASGFLLLPFGMLVLGAVLLGLREPVAAAIVVGAGLLVASTLRVRVAVGPAGLRVRGGPFGLVGTTVPLRDITAVRAERIAPMAYGGYGYRVKPGVRAVVVRDGPGLHVERDGRADLVVTVDGAEQAVGVLRAHLALVD
jgi:hypothetical protein